MVSPLLFGCGGQSASTTSTSTSTPAYISPLDGDWIVVSSGAPNQNPQLSISLFVEGSTIYGSGNGGAVCPTGSGAGLGTAVAFGGQIAADGSFTLSQLSTTVSPTWTITGTVPQSGSTSWNGTYTMVYPDCKIDQTDSFTATQYTPLNATLSGTMTPVVALSPTPFTATVQLSQSAAVYDNQLAEAYLPLSGTITVSGSSCFTHGTNGGGTLVGDHPGIRFFMDDGSALILSGYLDGAGGGAIDFATITLIGGQCSQSVFSGTLTRQ
jgi:hypothetical protein